MTPNWTSQLAPAHAPPPPGWWPPAPGWWVLAALLLAAIAAAVGWWRDPYRRKRRAALRELRAIRAADPDLVASAKVARLTGDAWLAFVAAHGGDRLEGRAGRTLLATAFGGGASDDRESWIAAADAFVRQARRKSRSSPPEKR